MTGYRLRRLERFAYHFMLETGTTMLEVEVSPQIAAVWFA